MILIRRCRGFRMGVPIPHRTWRHHRSGRLYSSDKGHLNAPHVWRWCCLDETRHRFGITGSGPTREVATERAMMHYNAYHCNMIVPRTVCINVNIGGLT